MYHLMDLEIFTPNDLEPPWGEKCVLFDEKWHAFLGDVATPFKALVWGLPGSGKSTLALQLANALPPKLTCLYIAAEEAPRSMTFRSRLQRTMPQTAALSIIAQLPRNGMEWARVLGDGWKARDIVIYDSITQWV